MFIAKNLSKSGTYVNEQDAFSIIRNGLGDAEISLEFITTESMHTTAYVYAVSPEGECVVWGEEFDVIRLHKKLTNGR